MSAWNGEDEGEENISLDELNEMDKNSKDSPDFDENDWGDSYDDFDSESWERQFNREDDDDMEPDPWELV